MSEALTLEFIGHRLDSIQADQRDLRLRVIALTDRFIEILEGQRAIERRMDNLERRFDGLQEGQSAMRQELALVLLRLSDLAARLPGAPA